MDLANGYSGEILPLIHLLVCFDHFFRLSLYVLRFAICVLHFSFSGIECCASAYAVA